MDLKLKNSSSTTIFSKFPDALSENGAKSSITISQIKRIQFLTNSGLGIIKRQDSCQAKTVKKKSKKML